MKKYLFILLLCLFAAESSAETVKLLSGKVIEGKIVDRTDDYIKIDEGLGMALTYYLDHIESIDGIKLQGSEETDEPEITLPIAFTEDELTPEHLKHYKENYKVIDTINLKFDSEPKKQGPSFDGKTWIVVQDRKDAAFAITEFVPEGQNSLNWQEMVTITQLLNVNAGFLEQQAKDLIVTQLEQTCTKADTTDIDTAAIGLMYIIEMDGCANLGMATNTYEHLLTRIVRARDRAYVMNYSSKTPIPEDKMNEWIKILEDTVFEGTENYSDFMQEVGEAGGRDLLNEVTMLLQQEDCQRAIPLLGELIEKQVDLKNTFLMRGECYYSLKDYSNAMKDYLKAMEFNPEVPELKRVIGSVYIEMGNMPQAENYLGMYLMDRPNDGEGWQMFALATNNVEYIDKAASLGFPDTYNLRGRIELRKEQKERGRKVKELSSRDDSSVADFVYLIPALFLGAGIFWRWLKGEKISPPIIDGQEISKGPTIGRHLFLVFVGGTIFNGILLFLLPMLIDSEKTIGEFLGNIYIWGMFLGVYVICFIVFLGMLGMAHRNNNI